MCCGLHSLRPEKHHTMASSKLSPRQGAVEMLLPSQASIINREALFLQGPELGAPCRWGETGVPEPGAVPKTPH